MKPCVEFERLEHVSYRFHVPCSHPVSLKFPSSFSFTNPATSMLKVSHVITVIQACQSWGAGGLQQPPFVAIVWCHALDSLSYLRDVSWYSKRGVFLQSMGILARILRGSAPEPHCHAKYRSLPLVPSPFTQEYVPVSLLLLYFLLSIKRESGRRSSEKYSVTQ